MQTFHAPDQWRGFAFRALWKGASVNSYARNGLAHGVSWDVSGSGPLACRKPVHREVASGDFEGSSLDGQRLGARTFRRSLDLTVRCRKCDACLKVRAWSWKRRAVAELAAAKRTWFTTLTLSAENQVRAKFKTIERLANSSVKFDDLNSAEQFAEIVKTIGVEITLMIKRVRKNSGATLRYMLVTERHKSGLPHFHMLWHETDVSKPVRWKHLDAAWRWGYSLHKLVTDHGDERENKRIASYLAKYLTKSVVSRVRCSAGYGQCSDLLPSKMIGNRERGSTLEGETFTLTRVGGAHVEAVQASVKGVSDGLSSGIQERTGKREADSGQAGLSDACTGCASNASGPNNNRGPLGERSASSAAIASQRGEGCGGNAGGDIGDPRTWVELRRQDHPADVFSVPGTGWK